jgi:glutamate racemase
MNPDRYAPVGVFDSGLGGLTVVREIMRNLPNERMVYFGDTARVPYGNKSKATIIRFSRQIVNFLKTQNVKAIVVACNTASALALEAIEPEVDVPIIGVVRPGTEMALHTTVNKRIGVIATEGTIRSNLYQTLLQKNDPEMKVFTRACPLFVPLVEEGWTKDPVTEEVARRYLKNILEQKIDTLIMGCTHYPLLRKLLQKVVGENVHLINPAYETALALGRLLDEQGLANDGQIEETHKYYFYASDTVEKFNKFANSILPYDIDSTKLIQIEGYRGDRIERGRDL